MVVALFTSDIINAWHYPDEMTRDMLTYNKNTAFQSMKSGMKYVLQLFNSYSYRLRWNS